MMAIIIMVVETELKGPMRHLIIEKNHELMTESMWNVRRVKNPGLLALEIV